MIKFNSQLLPTCNINKVINSPIFFLPLSLVVSYFFFVLFLCIVLHFILIATLLSNEREILLTDWVEITGFQHSTDGLVAWYTDCAFPNVNLEVMAQFLNIDIVNGKQHCFASGSRWEEPKSMAVCLRRQIWLDYVT